MKKRDCDVFNSQLKDKDAEINGLQNKLRVANDQYRSLEKRYADLEVSNKSEAERAVELGLMISDLKKKLQEVELQAVQGPSKPARKTPPMEQEENGESGGSAGWSDVGELDAVEETEPHTTVVEAEKREETKQVKSPRESPERQDDFSNVMEVANLRSEIRKLEGERDRFKCVIFILHSKI